MQDGRTGLSHAARNGHEEAARILLNAGAHPSEPDLVRKRLRCDSPPSLRAVLSKEQLPALIVVMLRLSCRLLQVQWNPLHYASAYGHANIVRVLLQSEKVEANAVTDVRMCWDLQLIYHELYSPSRRYLWLQNGTTALELAGYGKGCSKSSKEAVQGVLRMHPGIIQRR